MDNYEENALSELILWKGRMKKKPSFSSDMTKGIQNKMNNLIPGKIQNLINASIENMAKLVLAGSEYTSKQPLFNFTLEERENLAKKSIDFYRNAASASGAGTGASGVLVGLADFPILLS